MLSITIPSREVYDEESNMFFETKEYTLKLEHSLLSISKWESKYHTHFLLNKNEQAHSSDKMLYYIKCMTLNSNVPDFVYSILTEKNLNDIYGYIADPMTATTISNRNMPRNPMRNEIITSELIYYWMTAFNIPFDCEKWHINRLLMLIKVCNAMANPPKNVKPDMNARYKLNEQRLKAAEKARRVAK
jgi:hypothetical protein